MYEVWRVSALPGEGEADVSDYEQEIEDTSFVITNGVQKLADLTGDHIELVLGFPWAVFYKHVHPISCPERNKSKQLPAPAPADIPDTFKRMFEGGPTADEPKGEK